MTKELQDLAWACLPREFREEVKKEYQKGYVCETLAMLITLFGHHNLTSDAEEEELLTVSRKRVQNLYNYHKSRGHHLAGDSLIKLFGSKCLPDNVDTLADNVDSLEQKPADLNADRTTCTDVCSSQIDGRRLRIAAQMVPHVIGTVPIADNGYCKAVAVRARMLADALIAECMKGGVE